MKKLIVSLLIIASLLITRDCLSQYQFEYDIDRQVIDTLTVTDRVVILLDSIEITGANFFSVDKIITTKVTFSSTTGNYVNLGEFTICTDDSLSNVIRVSNDISNGGNNSRNYFTYHFTNNTDILNEEINHRYQVFGDRKWLVLRYILRLNANPGTSTVFVLSSNIFGTYQ